MKKKKDFDVFVRFKIILFYTLGVRKSSDN
jgi:hypothetical protein